MKKIVLTIVLILNMMHIVYAGQFASDGYGQSKYIKDDYVFAKSEWVVHDIDSDGYGEYFYFDFNGIMLKNTMTPDGYRVDNNGRWVVDGVVQQVALNNKSTVVTSGVINNNDEILYDKSGIDNFSRSKGGKFEDNGENTEGTENDPNTLSPKVVKAINKIRYWCNEDGMIIIPYSKRVIKVGLKELGYKSDIINRAIDDCNVDWKNHALIIAKYYKSLKYGDAKIKKILNLAGFKENGEIDFALQEINNEIGTNYLVPNDYVNLSKEQIIQKLKTELQIADDQIEQALVFIEYVNNEMEE